MPRGGYPRTPKPAGQQGDWRDSVVELGWGRVANGVFTDDPGSTECLMERDGLTCIAADDNRIGMHLSRQDLTPLRGTDALNDDTRSQPK
jgi:hypothetical protein